VRINFTKHKLKFVNWLKENDEIILSLVVIAIIIAFIVALITNNYRSKCLDSPAIRRYHADICDEWHDGEWVEINPSANFPILYNTAQD
jgi:hypothetical protein